MDEKLLLELFKIPAMSYNEDAMADFIKKKLDEYGIQYKEDRLGNIFNTDYVNQPILCAHMDTVQDTHDALLTDFIKIKSDYISGYGVIGGDDKCGIYIILEILKEREINFLFCVQEEVGGHGSSDWILGRRLDHILYGLVLDRMGNSDIICAQNNYGVPEFETFLHEIGKDFGYSPAMGTFSDADRLNELMSCANLSVGYYGAHTKDEFVCLSDLENSYKYVNAIISHVGEKFEKPDPRSYTYGGRSWYSSGYDYYDDYAYDDFGNIKKKGEERKVSPYGISMTDVECICCNTVKPTTYISSLNDFICIDCIGLLREELDDAESDIINSMTDEAWAYDFD